MIFASKEKELCGGKLVLTNFKKKKIDAEIVSCAPNGVLFLNNRVEGIDAFVTIFECLIPARRYDLEQYGKKYRKMYPGIKDFDDWEAWAATEKDRTKVVHMLTALLIPTEIKRREIERAYYNKKR